MAKHWIVINLAGAAIFVTALFVGTQVLLDKITQHDKYVAVPDFTNLQAGAARKAAEASGLVAVVTDSVFVPRMDRGAVFSQIPKAGASVKSGRKIRLTINAVTPKRVTMPDVVGLSFRQAKSELGSRGLYLGRIMYVSDMATNNVLKQLYNGAEIEPGVTVVSGASIDLMVGLNDSDFMTRVPDVRGMKYMRAMDVIKDCYLNVGRVRFDSTVRNYGDSLNAVVYVQSPAASEDLCRMGGEVALSLSLDPAKISSYKD